MALKELNLKCDVELIETDKFFEKFGIKKTPAMIIDGEIVLEGKNYSLEGVKKIIDMPIYSKRRGEKCE